MAFQHFLSKVMHLVTNPTTETKEQAEVCFSSRNDRYENQVAQAGIEDPSAKKQQYSSISVQCMTLDFMLFTSSDSIWAGRRTRDRAAPADPQNCK